MKKKDIIGKLTNTVSKTELPFSINPTGFSLGRSFDFNMEPRVGKGTPVVAFRSGNMTQLSFDLLFDKDVEQDTDLTAVQGFLKEIGEVDKKAKSTAELEFKMGDFVFVGFVTHFHYQVSRFDERGLCASASLAMQLISNGDYEEEK